MIPINGVALLLLKVIDLGVMVAQGSQRAKQEQDKIRSVIDRQLSGEGEGLTQAFVEEQTKRIEALEARLFEDPEGFT